jgi:hypothetical protein
MKIGETEKSVIHDAITQSSKGGDLETIESELYESLYGFRDSIGETPLNRPVKFPLAEVLKELKFGRTCEDQLILDWFLEELELE